jgi:hypothetical protein
LAVHNLGKLRKKQVSFPDKTQRMRTIRGAKSPFPDQKPLSGIRG